jgi:hypothetical protein
MFTAYLHTSPSTPQLSKIVDYQFIPKIFGTQKERRWKIKLCLHGSVDTDTQGESRAAPPLLPWRGRNPGHTAHAQAAIPEGWTAGGPKR